MRSQSLPRPQNTLAPRGASLNRNGEVRCYVLRNRTNVPIDLVASIDIGAKSPSTRGRIFPHLSISLLPFHLIWLQTLCIY